jgi:uncharacterized protein YdhG (YjbR/CyaY superfamily)
MASSDIDRYLASLDEPKRRTLEEMRRRILEVVPEAEQGLSYTPQRLGSGSASP